MLFFFGTNFLFILLVNFFLGASFLVNFLPTRKKIFRGFFLGGPLLVNFLPIVFFSGGFFFVIKKGRPLLLFFSFFSPQSKNKMTVSFRMHPSFQALLDLLDSGALVGRICSEDRWRNDDITLIREIKNMNYQFYTLSNDGKHILGLDINRKSH